jgi:hypothetical protein
MSPTQEDILDTLRTMRPGDRVEAAGIIVTRQTYGGSWGGSFAVEANGTLTVVHGLSRAVDVIDQGGAA